MMIRPFHSGFYVVTLAAVLGIIVSVNSSSPTSAAVTPYKPPVIASLTPERSRTPAVPSPADSTRLGVMPAGTGLPAIPSDVPKPLRTNEWWSSGMLAPWPAPVYAWPLVGTFTAEGVSLTTPGRRVHEKTVFADPKDPIRITAGSPGTRAHAIVAGDWDVTMRMESSGGPLLDATFTQGSPFAFFRSTKDQLTITLPAGSSTEATSCNRMCGSALLIKTPSTRYLVVSPIERAITSQQGSVAVRLQEGYRLLTVAAVAPGSTPQDYLAAAIAPFTGTKASFSVSDTKVVTTFRYPAQTVFGVFPHHEASLLKKPSVLIGTFETLRGPIRLYKGKSFQTSLARPSLLPSMPPLTSITGDTAFRERLRTEVTEQRAFGDAYAAAKELFRTAQLVEVADAVGDAGLRTQALAQSRSQLVNWCTASPGEAREYLAFDRAAGGIIAVPPAFGSERYNDHHFHYGYFLHAAAIVTRFDPTFAQQYGSCFRLLARDIASPSRNDSSFPYLRYFDVFGGHSWAAGVDLFGDGNNQESTSEAAHAWYAMALYGRTTGDKVLEDLGTWMFATESQATRAYWLNANPSLQTLPSNFPFPMISLLWGGKLDYATFFDAADAAIRGIQYFPVTPALFPVLDRTSVSRIVTPAINGTGPTIWKSGLQLVAALYDPSVVVPADAPIDPGISRSAFNQWWRSAKELGEPVASLAPCAGTVFRNGIKLTAVVYRFRNDPRECRAMVSGKIVRTQNLKEGWNVVRL